MRWIVLLVIFLIGIGSSIVFFSTIAKPQNTKKIGDQAAAVTPGVAAAAQSTTTRQVTLFVPYWQLDGREIELPTIDYAPSAAQRAVYFGVSVDKNGVTKDDPGYQNLSLFTEKVPAGTKKYLGVRMTDQDKNGALLEDPEVQKAIVAEVVSTAHDRQFDGIVVDLEFAPTLNSKLPAQINTFIESFYKASHEQNMHLAMTMYGDVFYRKRPYDIAYLSKVTDEIMIMAYDLHKASGEPGPNFPLQGKSAFGYDLETMAADFAGVEAQKLTVIYGMYGYDWVVDEKKRPFRPAKSVTLAQVKKNFIEQCAVLNCVTTRDKQAGENEIDFIDKQAVYHVVWFEDMESAKAKTAFLNQKGIGSIAFWAYGYF